MKREKTKHNLFSNVAYALRNIWTWDKAFYLFFIPSIPLAVLLPLAATYFPKVLIDAVESGQDNRRILLIVGIYFGALLIVKLLNGFCNSRLIMRKYNLSLRYQHAITEKYMRTDFVNTDHPDALQKYQHAMNDACSGQCAPEFIWQSLLGLFISLLGIVTYGSIIVLVSPWIIALLFLSAFVAYLITRWQRNYIEKNKNVWGSIDRKIGYLQSFSQKFDYAKDIRIYGMFDWFSDMLTGFHKERLNWTKRVSARTLAGTCVNAALTLLRNGLAYAVLIAMVLRNEIGAGDFVFLFGAVTGFSAWLNGIGNRVNDVVHKSVKIDYYRAYFEMDETYNHGVGCPLPAESELPVEIEFRNVSFRYPSSDAEEDTLKSVNLKIRKGEKLAIVGPNGAGKTTLVKLLVGFYYPTDGTILLNGRELTEYNIEEYYSLFSAVFQDLYLLPVTIAEFVSSSDGEIDRERVSDVLGQAGLKEKIDSLPNGIDSRLMKGVFDDSVEFSGGEKQKLMLARALYKNAPVIVLDEPTAALDPIAENELYLKYHELASRKTSVFISHRLASTRFCDRIVFLDHGEIVESGSHDELMKRGGKYAEMFEVQSHYYKEEKDA